MQKYEKLLSPIQIGSKTLRNRIVKTAAGSRYWSQDGYVTERVKALFDQISSGGAAMVVVDTMSFMPWSDAKFTMGGVFDDKYIPGLLELTELIHSNKCVAIAQLHHAGPADFTDPVGPSELTSEEMPLLDPPPRALTIDEIEKMKVYYFAAVERLVKAGFDGVEIHAAHGYFMASFISRVWNKRADQYGINSMEDRTRLTREIIRGVKEIVPDDFIVGVRFNGIEFGNERAITIEESTQVAYLLAKEGVDYLSVTGEGYGKIESPMLYLPVDYFPYPEPDSFMRPYIKDFDNLGTLIPAAEAIKNVVDIPVIAVGRQDEKTAEEILEKGKADLIGFNRALWADPDMPNKLYEGRDDEIRHCTRCGTCEGGGKISSMGPRVCRVNPALGRYELEINPATEKKTVMIIGGGPAGMEAACTAAMAGHKVFLYEKNSKLGGHLPLAAMIKGTYLDNVESLLAYQKTMLKKLKVTVKMGSFVTVDTVLKVKPDAVIVATGGKYSIEPVKGSSNKNSTNVNKLQTLVDIPLKIMGRKAVNGITKFWLPGVGKNVVVRGSGIAGLQGALWLKKRNRNVTIVSEENELADQMPPRYRNRLLPWFKQNNVDVFIDKKNLSISNASLCFDPDNNEITCNTLIDLPNMTADLELYNSIKSKGIEVYAAGSVKGCGNDLIVDAIHDGRIAGLSV